MSWWEMGQHNSGGSFIKRLTWCKAGLDILDIFYSSMSSMVAGFWIAWDRSLLQDSISGVKWLVRAELTGSNSSLAECRRMQLKNIKQPMEPTKWHPSLKFDCFCFPLFAFDIKDTTHSNFGTPFTVQSTQDRLHSNIFLQTIHERDICSPSMKLLQVTSDFKPWPLSVAELLVLSSSRWWLSIMMVKELFIWKDLQDWMM